MTSQSLGIHQLLQAEKRAKERLEEAKKGKGRRLKQAKDEAQAEIDQYRLQRESEFRQKQTSIMGSQGNLSVRVDEQTQAKINWLKSDHQQNREKVLYQLLGLVCEIKPEVHINFRVGGSH
ncbi:V-type proton ATPase subunit G 3 [Callorhinchus milii]|uniref:V-type proton ATPase subunit G n=1 Tax=Callorhinchus milii TaxID=7868 RepID=V9LIR0_CALMI|nr:V-type proton ATPase subunit G 3 [Callorhinchus milii]|eukprot:gi/632940800/ref/XP_007885510.1/ PREDICTED: V-type proton ATPase subunit G 3 [Callorhinchus milii]